LKIVFEFKTLIKIAISKTGWLQKDIIGSVTGRV